MTLKPSIFTALICCFLCSIASVSADKECRDLNSDCPQISHQCGSGAENVCPKTCGLCSDKPILTAESTPSSTPASCVDIYHQCAEWAKNGFCTKTDYPTKRRQKYCAKTCGLCTDEPPTSISEPTPRPTPKPAACVDIDEDCAFLASNGFCTLNRRQKHLCAKTCGLCTDEPSTSIATKQPTEATPESTPMPGPCVDTLIACADWAKAGFCTDIYSTPKLRQKYCAKTCGMCTDEPISTSPTPKPTPTPAPRCFDMSNDCANWVKNGFCINPDYPIEVKKRYCAKSCNLC